MVDWQSYLDGSMTAEERAKVDALLAEDENARRELEGFNEFRAAIRREGLSVETPGSLGRTLHRVSARRRLSPALASAASLLVVAALGLAWFLRPDPLGLARTPATEIIPVAEARSAAAWVREKTGYPAPVLDLADLGPIEGARYGVGWACYDYVIDGKPVFVYMSPAEGSFEGAAPVRRSGGEYYVGKGVGVKTDDLAFYVRGASEEVRWQVIRRIEAAQF